MAGADPQDPYAPRPRSGPVSGSGYSAPPTEVSGPSGPGAYWDGSGGEPPRRRRRLIAILAGLGVAALLAGIGAGLLASERGGGDTGARPAETAGTTTAGTTAPVTPATTAAGTATPGGELTSSSSTNAPLPEHPETVGADFGYIVMLSGGPKHMEIVFDRAQYLAGRVENTNRMKRNFGIEPTAGFVGTARLNNENGAVKREILTAEVFYENLDDALRADGKVAVWLRHTDGLEGEVTAVSEQYLP